MTDVLSIDPRKPEREKIQIAADVIRRGGTVAFPTETVYGLGADALRMDAVRKIFEAKRRPPDNPIIVHVAGKEDVHQLAEVPEIAEKLIQKFWPGPLTLVMRKKERVPSITTGGLDTVAIRMPDHNVALSLIKESGTPIAAPSANLAGRCSPTTAEHVREDLWGRIDLILDGGPTRIGVESTVLNLVSEQPTILRPGGISAEKLREILDVGIHPAAIAEKEFRGIPRSPGMKYRHYAPHAELLVVEGGEEKVKQLAEKFKREGKKVGILAMGRGYTGFITATPGRREDKKMVAKNLFGKLRELDKANVDIILAESMDMNGLGLAIMNRLRKASGYRIVR